MYIDVIVFENFIINFFILNITSRLSKIKTSKIKLFAGAIIGAFYIIIYFFPSLKVFFSLMMKVSVSILMIIIAFTPEKFKDFFKVLSIFYIISFAFGGAALAFLYFTGKGTEANGIFYIKDFPVSLLVMAFAVVSLLLIFCWDYIQDKIYNEGIIYNVFIELDKKVASFNAMLDTGNSLKDPITNNPVIVVEYDVIKPILPPAFSKLFTGSEKNNINFATLYGSNENDIACRIRLIPFTSLGKQNGMLIGVKPDSIVLVSQKKKNKRVLKDVIVGIYNNKISSDGQYNALLYSEILR
ncbi:MAG: sigma-E processing peptidase SpoIIGA [Clostridiales bacterium]|nr:sigma-E processing peptidase SpoIIGA [Clostridiales bacterium]